MKSLIVLVLVAIVATFTSCESRSARLARMHPPVESVKVVILDSKPYVHANTVEYKIKYIDKGVVGYTSSKNLYEVNDTILVKSNFITY